MFQWFSIKTITITCIAITTAVIGTYMATRPNAQQPPIIVVQRPAPLSDDISHYDPADQLRHPNAANRRAYEMLSHSADSATNPNLKF